VLEPSLELCEIVLHICDDDFILGLNAVNPLALLEETPEVRAQFGWLRYQAEKIDI
jgi:hypothetical protein